MNWTILMQMIYFNPVKCCFLTKPPLFIKYILIKHILTVPSVKNPGIDAYWYKLWHECVCTAAYFLESFERGSDGKAFEH